jgi:hypothetical protein
MTVLAGLTRVGDYVIAGQDAGTSDEKPRADLNRPWRAVAKRAGLQGVRIHDLRHTHASIGAGAGLGLPIIGKLLGHTKASTTQRYAHLDTDPLRRASENIGRRLTALMGDPAIDRPRRSTVVRMPRPTQCRAQLGDLSEGDRPARVSPVLGRRFSLRASVALTQNLIEASGHHNIAPPAMRRRVSRSPSSMRRAILIAFHEVVQKFGDGRNACN